MHSRVLCNYKALRPHDSIQHKNFGTISCYFLLPFVLFESPFLTPFAGMVGGWRGRRAAEKGGVHTVQKIDEHMTRCRKLIN